MGELLTRAGALFLAPEAPAAAVVAAAAPRAAQLVAVLAPERHLAAAAGAVAAGLRGPTAVVCGPPAHRRPATPRAGALARRLTARELDAAPAGRLCRVALPADPSVAVRDFWRVDGAVDVPVVLALARRHEVFDELLAQLDHLVLATREGEDDPLGGLALASLAALGPPAGHLPVPAGLAGGAAALGLHRVALPEPVVA